MVFQFFQPSLPEVKTDNPDDLISNNPQIPAEVSKILKTSCYDCHSNETYYPWYSNISPVSFLVVRDIEEGRKHLNFSNWESLSKLEKADMLDEINVEVSLGDMPMYIYTLIHRNAVLSEEDQETISTWIDNYAEELFE